MFKNIQGGLAADEMTVVYISDCAGVHSISTDNLFFILLPKTSVRRVNEPALAQCIAVLGDLCSDMVIRLQMVESQECWQVCLSLVVSSPAPIAIPSNFPSVCLMCQWRKAGQPSLLVCQVNL